MSRTRSRLTSARAIAHQPNIRYRLAMVALACVAASQIGVGLVRGASSSAVEVVEGQDLRFDLISLSGNRNAWSETADCTAVLICTHTCPACRAWAAEAANIDVNWVLIDNGADGQAFASWANLAPERVWVPQHLADETAGNIRLRGIVGTPTAALVDADGSVLQLFHPPSVPRPETLAAMCGG